MNSRPRPVKSLLYMMDAELGAVVRRAGYLDSVRQAVLAALPQNAAEHVHVADVDRQQLLLVTDSAGWATRLRYAAPSIQRALAQRMRLHVEAVAARVRPMLARQEKKRVPRHISAANRAHMRGVADHIEHAGLAQALRRLADHAQHDG
ncbi:MAG TPA: DciA family protein [Salinisphaeraceae bacterium]|nr:DciA family protein [Salinisphaeraceae bacterium]